MHPTPQPAPVTGIDQVLAALAQIIDDARAKASRIGYFAALYRRVTQTVKDDIAAGKFQNGALVEQLDVTFASRYLDALAQFTAGGRPTRSWVLAFGLARDPLVLILQQLLVGMNAHINLYLGIAAAAVGGAQLAAIQPDFDRINGILASLVGAVEQEIAEVSPAIGRLEEIGLRTGTTIINFSMQKARDLAWQRAQWLAGMPADQVPGAIDGLDAEVAVFGELVAHPPVEIDLALAPIRFQESNDVRRVIDVLARN